VGPDTILT